MGLIENLEFKASSFPWFLFKASGQIRLLYSCCLMENANNHVLVNQQKTPIQKTGVS